MIQVTPRSVLVLRMPDELYSLQVQGPESTGRILDKLRAETGAAYVMLLPESISLEQLNEEQMRAAGWVREPPLAVRAREIAEKAKCLPRMDMSMPPVEITPEQIATIEKRDLTEYALVDGEYVPVRERGAQSEEPCTVGSGEIDLERPES